MKTVLIDNSLCTFTLDDNARPEHIYKYIQALGDAGVKYVELDFRTILKMNELPETVGYVFRMVDPMFAELSEVFDFNYTAITLADLKKSFKVATPAILELPAMNRLSGEFVYLASKQIQGTLGAVRLRGSYPYMSHEDAAKLVLKMKSSVTVPVDLCPTNQKKTALDNAVKFTLSSCDSLTLSAGKTEKYASLEDFVFTLMSVYGTLPGEINIGALCRAAILHKLIFRSAPGSDGDSITDVMRLLDRDIAGLMNVDTGDRVRLHVMLRDSQLLHRTFVSALEKMAEEEDIPDDIMADITEAVKHYDTNVFDEKLLGGTPKGLLN